MSRLRRNFAFCSSKYSVKLSEIGAVYCDALIPNFTLPASGRRHNVAKSPGSRASGAGWAIPFARLRSAGPGGSGLALFERSEFSETPPGASTARQPEGPTQQGRPACTACPACREQFLTNYQSATTLHLCTALSANHLFHQMQLDTRPAPSVIQSTVQLSP